jgi:casein kinase 1
MIIGNKYKLTSSIGNGSFGSIFKGTNIRTNEEVAIKVETLESNTKLLKKEAQIYQYLGVIDNFPQVKWFGKDDHNYYMVLNLYGESIKERIEKKGTISIKEAVEYGLQMIDRIQVLHEKSLIHRDIKPDNFMFGLNNKSNTLYLIDYGFCKTYIINNEHIKEKNNCSLIGTPNFVSVNVKNGVEPSRRDDIESIIYVIMYMSSENAVFAEILEYVRKIKFEERPNYAYIKELLVSS